MAGAGTTTSSPTVRGRGRFEFPFPLERGRGGRFPTRSRGRVRRAADRRSPGPRSWSTACVPVGQVHGYHAPTGDLVPSPAAVILFRYTPCAHLSPRSACRAGSPSLSSLAIAAPALAQKEFGFDNRKASGQPYLKPEETVAAHEGGRRLRGQAVRRPSRTLVNPIAMTVDEKGRVWVVECFEYPKRTPKGKMPRDRIVDPGRHRRRRRVRQGDHVRRGQGLPGRRSTWPAASRSATAASTSAPRRTCSSSRTRTTSRASSRSC